MNFPIHHFKRCDRQSKLSQDHPIWQVLEPPEELFIQGSSEALRLLDHLPERGLAVVGTRNPQARTVGLLKKWIRELETRNLIIVSGLARGIDAVAHAASLEAGIPTIAVLGAGLNLDYPKQNRELRSEILKSHGLIISEFPPQSPAHGHHFLRRNRLIAGWSKATWVVEAGIPSGALSTARWAREQDRLCFAVPCFPNDPTLAGNQTLLDRDHALAFWGIHSLGAAWLDLASHSPPKTQSRGESSDLVQQIRRLTYQQGGAQIQELLEWTSSRGWSPRELTLSLQLAIEKKEICDHRGTLISI